MTQKKASPKSADAKKPPRKPPAAVELADPGPEPERPRRPSGPERERAKTVAGLLRKKHLAVTELAEKLEVSEDAIVKTLDEFVPVGDTVHFKGPGRGGPWIDPAELGTGNAVR